MALFVATRQSPSPCSQLRDQTRPIQAVPHLRKEGVVLELVRLCDLGERPVKLLAELRDRVDRVQLQLQEGLLQRHQPHLGAQHLGARLRSWCGYVWRAWMDATGFETSAVFGQRLPEAWPLRTFSSASAAPVSAALVAALRAFSYSAISCLDSVSRSPSTTCVLFVYLCVCLFGWLQQHR